MVLCANKYQKIWFQIVQKIGGLKMVPNYYMYTVNTQVCNQKHFSSLLTHFQVFS